MCEQCESHEMESQVSEIKLTDEERQGIQMVLRQAIAILGMIPLGKLQVYQDEYERSVRDHEAFAPVLDPGHYLIAQRDGTFEDAVYHNRIGRHLLNALIAAHEREDV